jgi:hypothetical protein
MKTFVTTLLAIDQTDGFTKKFFGQNILANNWEEAEQICKTHFPYLKIKGELVCELDEKTLKLTNYQLN